MIKVFLNDLPVYSKTNNLVILLKKNNIEISFKAVIVNNKFVPKSQYKNIILRENDRINILAPMQGG